MLSLRAKTQITMDRLNPEMIDQVVNRIHELAGSEMEVSVQTPRDRLENFFLNVVEEARAARVETSGVTVGAKASTFFAGIEREQKADAILDELLKTTSERTLEEKETARTQGQAVVVPLRQEPKADDQVISGLLKESIPAAATHTDAAAEQPAEKQQVVLPVSGGSAEDSKTTQEVLKDLLSARKPVSDGENDEASRSRETER